MFDVGDDMSVQPASTKLSFSMCILHLAPVSYHQTVPELPERVC
jgi:hypothetical protein